MKNYLDEVNFSENDIAVIGMALRLPGAKTVAEFWGNLCAGRESITFFSDEELLQQGILADDLKNPNYVKAAAILDTIENFDAKFFGFSPREAEVIDPQHRLFLTCCWEAIESAGYNPKKYPGRIGVFAGAGFNTYLFNLFSNPAAVNSLGYFQTMMMNGADHLTSVVSYKFNLTGPAVTVQTACSTSLVATHIGCQSLLQGESDMVLVGGASITIPQKVGYLFHEGGINSPDGHCRAFDAKAQGTVNASGISVVLLKRLSDALDDRDTIYAVIKGSAINNDGSAKIGYTAPSVDKQAEVILEAIEIAGVETGEISFVEAHGTATPLGDPIEIEALKRAFRKSTDKKNYCAIGSVKTNIGHTDTAAGTSGLIKTALSLYHRKLPQSLHFETPNQKIDFSESPFFVNTGLLDLSEKKEIIKAGVSSFGLGGTNAHLVLSEPPEIDRTPTAKKWHLLPFSAQSAESLNGLNEKYLSFLAANDETDPGDMAFTLQNGRQTFRYRRFTIARNTAHLAEILKESNPQNVFTTVQEAGNQPVAFLFPGLGSQYPRMGKELLQTNEFFRKEYKEIVGIFKDLKSDDFESELARADLSESELKELMMQPKISLPAIFCIEYALAKTLENYGIYPQMMLGHSFGEYAAACLGGVFSPENAAKLVLYRAELLEKVKGGAMLSVGISEEDVKTFLNGEISIAAINGKKMLTLSGSASAIEDLQDTLSQNGIEGRKIAVATAMHSPLIEPIMRPLEEFVASLSPQKPKIPYISCITGQIIADAEATDPAYWSKHLRNTVRFSEALSTLYKNTEIIPLEVGPGTTLTTLTRQHPERAGTQVPISIMKHPSAETDDEFVFLQTLGRLWLSGASVKMDKLYEGDDRRRVALPTYCFDEQKYWVYPGNQVRGNEQNANEDETGKYERPEISAEYDPPANEVEQLIADIWSELLGIEKIGRNDNFFELGGHSLIAPQFAAKIGEFLEMEIPLETIFQKPTVSEMAAFIEILVSEEVE
ncbi:MAG: acyltransferase domain-containing protein [Pyrinomonadaceae bacterium]|nr:acyltransferase domain-containing protein [Pyrinomonadaceae bacterium]